MATPNYEVNPNDERLVAVNREEEQTLNKNNTMYNSMIANSDKYFQEQINASKEWADKQTELQNEKTDFAIEQIEQQKTQATKDYTKEQSGAYVDWQKQSNAYGTNAEQMASQGLANSGYSESSQVSMYNTYQNRVAMAKESYNLAILNYNNAIKDARLQNNSVLAEIAAQSLQQQLELSLQGFQYKNQLLETQANKQLEIKNMYHSQYQDVLNQINKENALAEEVRQFNAQLKEEQEQFAAQIAEEKRQFNTTTSNKATVNKSSGGSGKTSSGLVNSGQASQFSTYEGGSSSKNASGNNSATMQSIIDLGYGPISVKKLDSLVASGMVKETVDSNGNLVFRESTVMTPYEKLKRGQMLRDPLK